MSRIAPNLVSPTRLDVRPLARALAAIWEAEEHARTQQEMRHHDQPDSVQARG